MRHLVRLTLVPAAVLAAVLGSTAAYATAPATSATTSTSAGARAPEYSYTMHLSAGAATVRPGGTATTIITFDASRRLQGLPVDMSVTGLPAGATATFSPRRPRVGGHTTLTVTTASGTPAGATTITVSAIINVLSSDPIGTTSPFQLTVSG